MAEHTTKATESAMASADNSGRRDAATGKLIDASGRLVEETGAHGMSLMAPGEHAGGAIADELMPDPPAPGAADPLRYQRRYMNSKLAKEAGNLIGRSPDNIGFWGDGDTYRGTGILVNIDTLEKVRVYDGYKFEGDAVYANTRDLPVALVNGDVTENLTGAATRKKG